MLWAEGEGRKRPSPSWCIFIWFQGSPRPGASPSLCRGLVGWKIKFRSSCLRSVSSLKFFSSIFALLCEAAVGSSDVFLVSDFAVQIGTSDGGGGGGGRRQLWCLLSAGSSSRSSARADLLGHRHGIYHRVHHLSPTSTSIAEIANGHD